MQEIWRNSWVVSGGGGGGGGGAPWVAVWFEEVGGRVITWFSRGTEGDQSLPTEYEGGDFWKLNAN